MPDSSFISSINEVQASDWDCLFQAPGRMPNPFLRHAFLAALEDSQCVGGSSGWVPCHLLLSDERGLVGAAPLYEKHHSYGEFVFDWSWAQAYERHGFAYYPKLLTAAPFTPSVGPRLGVAPGRDRNSVVSALTDALIQQAEDTGSSGWHLLFSDIEPSAGDKQPLLQRQDIQFHWHNPGYRSFDDYLARLKSSRRKNLRRERRKVAEQGVTMERYSGTEICQEDWDGFYQCYVATYLKRSGHGGYLNREFFKRLRNDLSDQLMLVVARRAGQMIAGALFLYDSEHLYGRYWGALEAVSCLHFETCFYQGMEFAIERGLDEFDPGTQGEHKLLRGFEPVTTRSWHWISDPRFREAIANYLEHEREATETYGEQASGLLPFRADENSSETGGKTTAQGKRTGQVRTGDADQRGPGERKTS